MKKTTLFMTSLLTGCTITNAPNNTPTEQHTQLNAPQTLQHNGKNYQRKADSDLGTIARFVYLEDKDSLENWNSEIELLHDRNQKHFDLQQKNNALYSFVIYSPTPTQSNWQVNVARGEQVENCGFVQYQYIVKVPKTQKLMNMSKVKLIGYLKKYVVDKERTRLENLPWQWHCAISTNS